jgi:hypothetical protein
MKGERVSARGFKGVLTIGRVWAVGNGLVYLSSESEFAKLESLGEGLSPIGFPIRDVFAYNEAVLRIKTVAAILQDRAQCEEQRESQPPLVQS